MRMIRLICSLLLIIIGIGYAGCDVNRNDLDVASIPVKDFQFIALDDAVNTETQVFDQQREIKNSIVIGLDADMSSGSAQSGESIRRGALLAIEQINATGGLLGRKLELIVRDHRGNPDRGIDNVDQFSKMKDVVAVLGGLHTPVALRELEVIHDRQLIYLSPWAAGTKVVENGYSPNFVFRVSVRDEYAGGFLVQSALDRRLTKLGLLLERTAWGRSNEKSMRDALESQELPEPAVEWFNWGEKDFKGHLDRLADNHAQAIILVCNSLEGAAVIAAMATVPESRRLPIISHWGITGADFPELTSKNLRQVDLTFLQTHSFISPKRPEPSKKLFESYARRFEDCQSPQDVFSPAGTAHAYEIVMILANAVRRAGTIDRVTVRAALEDPVKHHGVIRTYDPPFRPDHHDALTADDFMLARYSLDGVIVPVEARGSPK